MLKVNNIFNSFQGEGVFTGTPATFLRLSDCNLNCDFCDTDFSENMLLSSNMVKNIIVENMEKYHTKLLVITGGEPLLQYNELKHLINQLNYIIQIETNGLILKKPLNATYMISPKKDIEKIFTFYKNYDNIYFKFIIQNLNDLHQIEQLIEKYDYTKTVYLQPEYSKANEITQVILNKKLSFNYKISGQLHKYMGVD